MFISDTLLVLQGGKKKLKSSKFLWETNVFMYLRILRCTLYLTVNKKLGVDFRQSNFCDGEVESPNSKKTLEEISVLQLLWCNYENILIKLVLAFMS